MGAIANGIALYGLSRIYVGTFLVFSDYMRGSVRLSALMNLPVTYVFTHDSIGLGEDGPTHQPIEHAAALRAIPRLTVIRPADANEVSLAWQHLIENPQPAALLLSRQNLPVLEVDPALMAKGVARGAYIALDTKDSSEPKAIIIATGSEVHDAVAARETLQAEGLKVRVVSMPCWELFEQQDAAYRESVLPKAITRRVSFEAGTTHGWERWVGDAGISVGIDHYGASAPGGTVAKELGLTADAVVAAVRALG